MDRQDFMDIVYSELESDPDNNRANRIICAADGYAERRVDDALQVIEELQSVQLGTNLAEVGTDCISRQAFGTIKHAGPEHPLSDSEIIPRLREIRDQVGGSYAIDRVIELMQAAQPELCEDAVSRKAAIAQMQGLPKWDGIIADSCVDFEDVISVLENKENLPSVTPKQRTGKWIKVTNTLYKCNRCEAVQFKGHFCKDCGAKMEGDAE